MDIVSSPEPTAPALRMPMMAAPVLRQQVPGGSTPTGGVEAAGLFGFINDIANGNWGGMGKDIVNWLTG